MLIWLMRFGWKPWNVAQINYAYKDIVPARGDCQTWAHGMNSSRARVPSYATLRHKPRLNKFSLPKVDQPHTHTYKGVVEKRSFSFYSKSEKWASNTCGIIHWVYARCCVRKGTNSWTPEHICLATKFYLTLQFSSMIWTSMQGYCWEGSFLWRKLFLWSSKRKRKY